MPARSVKKFKNNSQPNQDGEVLVKVDNLSKKFCRSLKRSLWYGMQDIGSEIIGRNYNHDLRQDEFWSVKDVSFELRRGECLGLIGPNGAGKSTLLKMLNGIIKPDRGKIEICGRVAALIELGAGFNPILTGLENIYNNAAVLGFTKSEVDQQLDSIVDFAELKDFINTPVQNYSSGMKVRLGFAVAAHLYPDVMIIDEVLAVGDVGFKAKCLEYIGNMSKNAAVILVSHSMPMINRYCNKVVMLDRGKMFMCDESSKVIERYYSLFEQESARITCLPGNHLEEFTMLNSDNEIVEAIDYCSSLRIKISAILDSKIKDPVFKILFLNRELQVAASCESEPRKLDGKDNFVSLIVDIDNLILNPSQYKLSLVIRSFSRHNPVIWYDAYWNLRVLGEADYGSNSVRFPGQWRFTQIGSPRF